MVAMTERRETTHQPALSEEIGDAVFRLARALDRDMAAAAAPEGLTPLAARILRNIGTAESQRALGRELGVGPAQVSVATTELVSRKFVERKGDASDHRLRRPQLTARGRAAVARIDARMTASSPIAKVLDERQMKTLLKSLLRIDAAGR
jgi:DNA-binding MarR family transcriptional regulator